MATNKQQKKSNLLQRVFLGKIISFGFFKRNWAYVAGILTLLLVFIASKYKVQTQMEEIMRLTKDLNNAKTEMVKESSNYNSRIREPEMRILLDTLNVDLTMPDQPPYHL